MKMMIETLGRRTMNLKMVMKASQMDLTTV